MAGLAHDSSAVRQESAPLEHGISVIIATHQGAQRLPHALDSLIHQTLDPRLFEVIVVENGPRDDTSSVIDDYVARFPQLKLRLLWETEPGVAHARNVGMDHAAYCFVTFLDDDDRVTPPFLEVLLEHSHSKRIAIGQLADVTRWNDAPAFETYVNRATLPFAGRDVSVRECPTALSFATAKSVPTEFARTTKFTTSLRSGSDVVFWHRLAHLFDPSVFVIPPSQNAVYFRLRRASSLSRPSATNYQFSISDRLKVIECLTVMANDPDSPVQRNARNAVNSQARHMQGYLRENPQDLRRILDDVTTRGIKTFPKQLLAQGLGRHLVVAYVFAPSNSASSLVMARRVRSRAEVVDVISKDMGDTRKVDASASEVVAGFIDRHTIVEGPVSMGGSSATTTFCDEGLQAIANNEQQKGRYESIYSRAMWPASHVLAALHKVRNDDVPWTAEFSDPLSRGVDGLVRTAALGHSPYIDEINSAVAARGFTAPPDENFYEWVEAITYALADRIVFTNENQMRYMLGYSHDPQLVERVERAASIEEHPKPDPALYSARTTDYSLDPDKVNIAYFGNFYPTRGLDEVIEALGTLDGQAQDRVRVHVFTPNQDTLHATLSTSGVASCFVVSDTVPYLEFLNLTTNFDCLLMSDARTVETHSINPYLPSKWSDYAGSGRPVWALVEEGSPLSTRPLDYRSELGDVPGARDVLLSLLANLPPQRMAESFAERL